MKKSNHKKTITIIKGTFISGIAKKPGDVVEVPEKDAALLVATGKAAEGTVKVKGVKPPKDPDQETGNGK